MGRLGPADQFHRRITFLLSRGIFIADLLLHLRQQLVVIDLGGIGVVDVTTLLVLDQHAPAVLIDRPGLLGKNHSQRGRPGRIAPEIVQHLLGIGPVQETVTRTKRDLRQPIPERDRSRLPF